MIQEFRCAKRRKAHQRIPVIDTMTGEVLGHIGNLPESGMLLLAAQPLANDALYQFRFTLVSDYPPETIEVGVHLLWSVRASAPGQHWIGFRFIGLSDHHVRQLRAWVHSPGNPCA